MNLSIILFNLKCLIFLIFHTRVDLQNDSRIVQYCRGIRMVTKTSLLLSSSLNSNHFALFSLKFYRSSGKSVLSYGIVFLYYNSIRLVVVSWRIFSPNKVWGGKIIRPRRSPRRRSRCFLSSLFFYFLWCLN